MTVRGGRRQTRTDALAVEEPMEIRVNNQNIAITMRTPGHDFELAAGFLLTEGVITRRTDIHRIRHCGRSNLNTVNVELESSISWDPDRLTRHVFTTSSCGICGRTSLDQVRTILPDSIRRPARAPKADTLVTLSSKLTAQQPGFAKTGGLHASALFDLDGDLLAVREDVGRHNALDKLIGALLLADHLPANERMLLVSGRASFELVQKAAMAGIPILVAVGAPSSLAVETASELGITLVGFVREDRFNVYSGAIAD